MQREGITNSGTVVSASSTQQLVHPVTSSPPSRNALSSHALRENRSNISLPLGPEETRKRNESPHPQEDSRSQRTVIRPHAVQVDRTASVQSSVKPSTSYPPPSSSSERTNTHAEKVDRIAPIQPSAKPSTPSFPPSSSSERNATRPHADPVNRTTSSSVQSSVKPSNPYPPPFASSERNATIPHAEPVNRTASVQPPAKPSVPSPLLDRPSASISPSSPPAPALAKMASSRIHPPRGILSRESQAQFREALSESPHPPLVDRGNVRSDEQVRKDPSAASRRPPAPPEHTPATTKPPRHDYKDPSAVPQRPPVPPEHTPSTTTDFPSRQDRKVPSSDRPPVRSEHTPAMAVSPSLQDPKEASAAPSRPPILPKHTPAPTDLPSNYLSQPVSGPDDLNRSKSGIQGNEGVDRGAERDRVLAPEHENRLKDSANVKPNLTTHHVYDVLQHPRTPSESSLQRTDSSSRSRGYGSSAPLLPDLNDSRRTGDGPSMRAAGDEPQTAQRHQAKGGNFVGVMSSSPPDSEVSKSRDLHRPEKLFGKVVDARPLPAQPLSASISPRT